MELIMHIREKEIPFKIPFLLWSIWRKRIPIGEVLVKIKVDEEVICCYCNNNA